MALADINIRIGANLQQLEKSLGRAQKRINRFSRKMQRSGQNLTRNVTLPLAAIGGVALKAAADFETAMVEVQKVTDATTADTLSDSIRGMSEEIPMAQDRLAGLAADAARFGIKGVDNIENFTRVTAKMAEATDLTADRAGEALAKIGNMADVPVENIENLGSAINELSNNFATSSSEIVDSMLRSSAAASNFGLSDTQIAGISAQMNAMSESAERAGTRIRSLFQSLQDPDKLKQIAEAIGMNVNEFKALQENNPQQALMTLVNAMARNGQEADNLRSVLERTSRTALTALAKNTDDMTRALGMSEQAFKDNTSLQEEFEAANKTFNAQLQRSINRLRNIGITVGNMIMPAVKDMIDVVENAADWFAGLSEQTQKNIVKFTSLVALLGPVKFAIGAVAGQISRMIKVTRKGIGGMQRLIGKFGAARVAAGGAALAVVGLVAGYILHNQKIKNFNNAQDELRDATTEAKKAIVEEKTRVDKLISSIEKENTTREEKKAALDKLQSIAPSYFDNLKVEKGLIEDLRKKQEEFNTALLRGAKIDAYKEKLTELQKELIELEEGTPDTNFWQGLEGAVKSVVTGGLNPLSTAVNQTSAAMEDHQTKVENTKDAIAAFEKKLKDVSLQEVWTGKQTEQFNSAKKQANDAADAVNEYARQIGSISTTQSKEASQSSDQNVVQSEEGEGMPSIEGLLTENTEKINSDPPGLSGINLLIDGWDKLSKKVQQSVKEQLKAENNLTQGVTQGAKKQAKMQERAAQRMQQAMSRTSDNVIGAVTRMSQQGEKSLANYAKAAANSARKTIAAEIASGIAAYVSSALKNVPFPFGIIAAGAAAAAASALFNSIVPSFAQGGAISGPQQVIAGDNPSGREAIIPFERIPEFVGMMTGVRNNNQPQELYSYITNRGIYMSNQRGKDKNKRIT